MFRLITRKYNSRLCPEKTDRGARRRRSGGAHRSDQRQRRFRHGQSKPAASFILLPGKSTPERRRCALQSTFLCFGSTTGFRQNRGRGAGSRELNGSQGRSDCFGRLLHNHSMAITRLVTSLIAWPPAFNPIDMLSGRRIRSNAPVYGLEGGLEHPWPRLPVRSIETCRAPSTPTLPVCCASDR